MVVPGDTVVNVSGAALKNETTPMISRQAQCRSVMFQLHLLQTHEDCCARLHTHPNHLKSTQQHVGMACHGFHLFVVLHNAVQWCAEDSGCTGGSHCGRP